MRLALALRLEPLAELASGLLHRQPLPVRRRARTLDLHAPQHALGLGLGEPVSARLAKGGSDLALHAPTIRPVLLICAGRSLSSLPRGFEVVEVGRVRAGAQAYLGPRPGVGSPAGDMMVDGVLFPLGEALRPLGLWRPSTRTWRQQHAGSRPRCIGDIQALRAREVSRRRERLVSEFSKCVVAAFEQLASKRQARAVTAEPLGGLPVVVAVRRPWTPGGLGGLV